MVEAPIRNIWRRYFHKNYRRKNIATQKYPAKEFLTALSLRESLTALYKQYVRPVLAYASSVWQPDLAQSHMQVLQRTQNSALRIATGCTRLTPTAHLHAETKDLPLKDYLKLRGTQMFSAAAAPEHALHEGLYNPVGTRRHIHTTPSSHYTALRAMIPSLLLGRSESSWLHQNFVARALVSAPPYTLLGKASPPVNPDEADLHRQERVHLARLRCGHHLALRSYEGRLRPEVGGDSVGKVRRRFLIPFRSVRSLLWSKLMSEWATQEICGMRPQWPWDSRRPLGLEGVRRNPYLGARESVLWRMRWLLRHFKRVQEGLSNNNNNNNPAMVSCIWYLTEKNYPAMISCIWHFPQTFLRSKSRIVGRSSLGQSHIVNCTNITYSIKN